MLTSFIDLWNNFVSTNFSFNVLGYIIRLVCAGLAGAIIGLERNRRFKDAGVRTHMILALGCALAMIVSKYAFGDILADSKYDASRIASTILTGVGFLGAGVIFIKSGSVHGLTTAAGIWVTSVIGMAFGAGFYSIGTFVTVFLIFIQILMYKMLPSLEGVENSELFIKAKNTPYILNDIKRMLQQDNIHIQSMKVRRTSDKIVEVHFSVQVHKDRSLQTLLASLSNNDDIIEVTDTL